MPPKKATICCKLAIDKSKLLLSPHQMIKSISPILRERIPLNQNGCIISCDSKTCDTSPTMKPLVSCWQRVEKDANSRIESQNLTSGLHHLSKQRVFSV